MTQGKFELSEYKGVWLFAMFDLPTVTKEERKRYTEFRRVLLQDGFIMIQYSVYARYCATEEASKVHRKRVRAALPPAGWVRLLHVTDKQYGKMESYIGRKKLSPEDPPPQMMLF